MRLEALQLESGMFGNSYAPEAAFPESEWNDRLTNPGRTCFGLYCGDGLIGITAAIIDSVQPKMAYMTQSYIRKEHRGKGLSALLYEARIDWARRKKIKVLTISHRESNLRSRAAMIRNDLNLRIPKCAPGVMVPKEIMSSMNYISSKNRNPF